MGGGSKMTTDELRALVREQIEWRQVFHHLVPRATSKEAISVGQICVYVTYGTPEKSNQPPPHRYLHVVSSKQVDMEEYGQMLVAESARWNALTDKERVEAANARVGNDWQKAKILARLEKKGFLAH